MAALEIHAGRRASRPDVLGQAIPAAVILVVLGLCVWGAIAARARGALVVLAVVIPLVVWWLLASVLPRRVPTLIARVDNDGLSCASGRFGWDQVVAARVVTSMGGDGGTQDHLIVTLAPSAVAEPQAGYFRGGSSVLGSKLAIWCPFGQTPRAASLAALGCPMASEAACVERDGTWWICLPHGGPVLSAEAALDAVPSSADELLSGHGWVRIAPWERPQRKSPSWRTEVIRQRGSS
jgi:hypothetical protein